MTSISFDKGGILSKSAAERGFLESSIPVLSTVYDSSPMLVDESHEAQTMKHEVDCHEPEKQNEEGGLRQGCKNELHLPRADCVQNMTSLHFTHK